MSTPARFGGPLGFAKANESDAARVDAFLIKPVAVTGRELTVGVGEVLIDIHFPVWFVERPNMTFGGELDENDFVTDRKHPTVSMVVVAWEKKQADRVGGGYYVGAQIACVTTGRVDNRIWLHWRAEGDAMQNPVVDMTGTYL